MIVRSMLALALAAGLLGSMAGNADAAVLRNDQVRAKLVQTRDGGYQVVLRFQELTRNDRLSSPVKLRKLLGGNDSKGVKDLVFKRGGKLGARLVVVRLTRAFGERVAEKGSAETSFRYLIGDGCKKAKCGGPIDRAKVTLRVISPS